VYDVGVAEDPSFGKAVAERYPGCEVHAFAFELTDAGQWAEHHGTGGLKNYHLHLFGGAGVDGETALFSHPGRGVSTLKHWKHVVGPCALSAELAKELANQKKSSSTEESLHGPDFFTKCKLKDVDQQNHQFPARTLSSIMVELGHASVSALKLSLGGAEYGFLEQALDHFGCPPVQRLSVEWRFFTFDTRFGGGSSPEMHGLVAPLDACGLRLHRAEYADGGEVEDGAWARERGIALYSTVTSHTMVRA
jgi:hypothetical protein